MSNYWSYKIYRGGYDGKAVFVAEYVAETSPEAVKKDLAEQQSTLQGYLKQHFGIEAQEYFQKFAQRAEALLGGLVACRDCSLRFGMWLPVQAPAARHCHAPANLGDPLVSPFASLVGVRLWLRQKGYVQTDVLVSDSTLDCPQAQPAASSVATPPSVTETWSTQ